jgi:hypothetical protein
MNSKAKGDITEARVLYDLLKNGSVVLQPFGDNQRYDLVVDNGLGVDQLGKKTTYKERFSTIQCKTGRLRNGVIYFNTKSSQSHRGKGTKNYRGEVDCFGVYCPDNNKSYLIPVDWVGTSEGHLRITPTKNNKKANIKWAKDFEMSPPDNPYIFPRNSTAE